MRAPRSLKAAMNCRFSNFTTTVQPRTADRVREWALGVRCDRPGDAARGGQDVVVGDGQVGAGGGRGGSEVSVGAQVRRLMVTSSRTSGSGSTPRPGPSGTIMVPSRTSNGGVRSVVEVARRRSEVGRQGAARQRGHGQVERPAEAGLQHAPAPQRHAGVAAALVDAACLDQAADPPHLEADRAAGPEGQGRLEVVERADRLVEADGHVDLAGQPGVADQVVGGEGLLDGHQPDGGVGEPAQRGELVDGVAAVAAVGVDHQGDLVAHGVPHGAHRLDVPPRLHLELERPVALAVPAQHDVDQVVDRARAADGDARGDHRPAWPRGTTPSTAPRRAGRRREPRTRARPWPSGGPRPRAASARRAAGARGGARARRARPTVYSGQ